MRRLMSSASRACGARIARLARLGEASLRDVLERRRTQFRRATEADLSLSSAQQAELFAMPRLRVQVIVAGQPQRRGDTAQ